MIWIFRLFGEENYALAIFVLALAVGCGGPSQKERRPACVPVSQTPVRSSEASDLGFSPDEMTALLRPVDDTPMVYYDGTQAGLSITVEPVGSASLAVYDEERLDLRGCRTRLEQPGLVTLRSSDGRFDESGVEVVIYSWDLNFGAGVYGRLDPRSLKGTFEYVPTDGFGSPDRYESYYLGFYATYELAGSNGRLRFVAQAGNRGFQGPVSAWSATY